METAAVEPSNEPMHEQNERENPQGERRLLATRPHAFAQEVRVERSERNDHDDREDCEIGPKAGTAIVPAAPNNAAAAATTNKPALKYADTGIRYFTRGGRSIQPSSSIAASSFSVASRIIGSEPDSAASTSVFPVSSHLRRRK